MKKKVVIIGPAYPYRGGQSLVEAHLFDTLDKLGYSCETISFSLLYPKLFFPGTTQYDTSGTIFFEHNDKIHRIINSINPWTWYKAAKKIKSLSPDLVIFVWWMPFFGPAYSFIARLIKKWTKAKISFLVENYISHENRWFDRYMSIKTLSYADSFICQSDYIRKSIEENHPNKDIHKTTLSVFECYDLKRYSKSEAREKLAIENTDVLLFFGLIRRYKGLDKLILSIKTVSEKYKDYTLLIVGECYDDPDYYTDLIKKEGIENNTIFINQFIANEDIEPYFRAADVVCLPYYSATQSGILMMAYGFGIPAIVTDVGGLSELIVEKKTGYVVKENTVDGLAKTIIEFLDNKEIDYAANIKNLNSSLGYQNMIEIIPTCISA